MKQKTPFAVLMIFALIIICKNSYTQTTFTKLVEHNKKGIIAYLQAVISNNQVIIGQQCSETPDVARDYQRNFQRLFDSTGKYPALLGMEYGYFPNIEIEKVNSFAIDHWKKGGLVTISWHADNPFTDGYNVRWNSVQNKDSILINKLLKNAPDSKEKTNYRTELTRIARALKQLKDAGVVVLWRPFHEVNGTWFWWCANNAKAPTNQEAYAALWKDMYQTFTVDYGLDNLIWVYSPNAPGNAFSAVDVMYPGAEWVDIVAVDIYNKQPVFADYEALRRLNKIVVNGEVGPVKENMGNLDEAGVLNLFKGKAAYFLQWHSWTNAKVAIVDNLNYKQLMNDPAAITLDKMR